MVGLFLPAQARALTGHLKAEAQGGLSQGCSAASPAMIYAPGVPHRKQDFPPGTAQLSPPGFTQGDPGGQGCCWKRRLFHAVSLPEGRDEHLPQVLRRQNPGKPTPHRNDATTAQEPSHGLSLPLTGERGSQGGWPAGRACGSGTVLAGTEARGQREKVPPAALPCPQPPCHAPGKGIAWIRLPECRVPRP